MSILKTKINSILAIVLIAVYSLSLSLMIMFALNQMAA